MNPQERLAQIKEQALKLQGGVNTLAEAEKQGLKVTPKTTVQDAERSLGRNPTPPLTPLTDKDGAIDATTLQSGGTPTLPEPTAQTEQGAFQLGIAEQATKARTDLESTLKTERDAAMKRQTDLNKKMQSLIKDSDPEKRATYQQEQRIVQNQIDASETASASLEEDFNKRRKTVNELDTLLTQGNQLITQAQGAPISQYRSRGVTEAVQNVQARAGVLQAVVSGLDGNINAAHSIINNASNAVASVWQDQLSYNEAYVDLVNNGELAKNKIEDDYAQSQITLSKTKLNQLEETKSYIESLMIDPESAQFIADAGISLNDSVDEINAKMSAQTKKVERADTINELKLDGYEYIPFPGDREDVVTLEINGEKLSFVPPVDELKEAQIASARALANKRNGSLTPGSIVSTPTGQAIQVPTFEEFISEKENELMMSLTPEAREKYRDEYEAEIEVMNQASAISNLSPTAKEIVKNPKGYFDLTATQKGKIIDELARNGIDTAQIQNGKKRPLSATQADDLVQAQIARKGVENLKSKLDALQETGPVIGRARQMNPYDPEVVAIMAEINRIVPGLARGIFKEVGVLTDTDIERYTATLANPRATKEQIEQLHADTMQKIDQTLNIIQSTYGDLGYDLGKFEFDTNSSSSEGLSDDEAYKEYLKLTRNI